MATTQKEMETGRFDARHRESVFSQSIVALKSTLRADENKVPTSGLLQ